MPMPNSKHKNRGVKMMLLIPENLKMKPGKLGAQTAHGALGLYMKIANIKKHEKMIEDWMANGQKKICAKIKDEGEMNTVMSKATDEDIEFYCVQDAGKTQVAAGSRTVLALIGYENKLNTITGRFKLM